MFVVNKLRKNQPHKPLEEEVRFFCLNKQTAGLGIP